MSMRKAIEVIANMAKQGVIKNYAVTGAVATLAYVEPIMTQDLDILVAVDDLEERMSGLVLLTPVHAALAAMGYTERSGAGVLVEGWPVEFLPVASELDAEALQGAAEVEFKAATPPFKARVLRPEHIVAKAIEVGRLKDLARVEAFLDQQAVDLGPLRRVIERHGLVDAWRSFCMKSGRPDPFKELN